MHHPSNGSEPAPLPWALLFSAGLLLTSYPWVAPLTGSIAGVPLSVAYMFAVVGALILAAACLRAPD